MLTIEIRSGDITHNSKSLDRTLGVMAKRGRAKNFGNVDIKGQRDQINIKKNYLLPSQWTWLSD